MIHDPTGGRVADYIRNTDGQHEERGHLGPLAVREPVRQIVEDPGKGPRLGNPECPLTTFWFQRC